MMNFTGLFVFFQNRRGHWGVEGPYIQHIFEEVREDLPCITEMPGYSTAVAIHLTGITHSSLWVPLLDFPSSFRSP